MVSMGWRGGGGAAPGALRTWVSVGETGERRRGTIPLSLLLSGGGALGSRRGCREIRREVTASLLREGWRWSRAQLLGSRMFTTCVRVRESPRRGSPWGFVTRKGGLAVG